LSRVSPGQFFSAKDSILVYYDSEAVCASSEGEFIMDVSSVSSSLNSALITASSANSQATLRTRQSEQDSQAQQSAQTQQSAQAQQPSRTQQAQSARPVDANEASARARSEAESNRPSVNTSGQVVGTRVNTTA
jgi:hypothetical protein